ncbi:MAG: hypothetical protein NC339_00680 [Muribaculaceae bacterium]|nr:hypothetical protein [Muribaculaceae bacterium]
MKYPGLSLLLSVMLAAAACTDSAISDQASAQTEGEAEIFESTDLSLMELRHRVKRVTTTTYWRATPGPDSVAVDTTASNVTVTVAYFDSLGNYVARRDERIRRDEYGRMVRWEDRRPNLNRQHGGFLKDTLSYEHLSPNVVMSNGMGDFAVTVYDDSRRIVGQYTDPAVDGEHTAVFNIYRSSDQLDNWTERLSVWTTQQPGSRPHISYTLQRRDIVYY